MRTVSMGRWMVVGTLCALVGCGTDRGGVEQQPGDRPMPVRASTRTDAGASDASGTAADLRGPADQPAVPPTPADTKGPDYATAFPEDRLGRINIRVSAADWQRMTADMTDMFGKHGGGGLSLPVKGLNYLPRTPVYVPATVSFAGHDAQNEWTNVGLRFRGNATLVQAWRAGESNLPLGLDFDEFEDAIPEVRNQRFFGTKSVALMSGHGDESLVREKVAGDLMRAAGVPCGRAAFYKVYLDKGAGLEPLGVYTAVEVPAKPMLAARFGNDQGNLYKPDGPGAKLAMFEEDSFEKKTNEKQADFSDVRALIAALSASRSDAATWRAGLERTIDVDGFLLWLAANQLLANWDTYGVLEHNYYLYGDPAEGGRLRWVAWDLGNAFTTGLLFWTPRSFGLKDVGGDWPLIHHVLEDPVYQQTYKAHLRRLLEGPLSSQAVNARLRAAHDLIAPAVTGADEDHKTQIQKKDFEAALDQVTKIATDRSADAAKFLSAK